MFYIQEQRDLLEMFFPDMDRYQALLDSLAGFFEKEILPGAKRVDDDQIFPRENLARLTDHGFFGLPFPEKHGGTGLPFTVYVAAIEMLAKACANTALQASIQGMICEGIRLFGSDKQRERYLKEYGLLDGRKLISFALTEPCCGSDAGSLETRADISDGSYILNGNKMLITNPGETDFSLVFARTDKGISCFLVSTKNPGFNVLKSMPKLGFRGNQLAAIHLKDCRVQVDDLLGNEGEGLEYAKHILNSGRITIAALGVGIAQAALEKSLQYSNKRKAFGKSIGEFELVGQKLSDMATEISAARLLTYHASFMKYKGKDIAMQAAQAKLFSSEMALRVCDHAIQVHGGYGYTDGYDIHRHWRDARLLTIGEGTSDMLRMLIAHLAQRDKWT